MPAESADDGERQHSAEWVRKAIVRQDKTMPKPMYFFITVAIAITIDFVILIL